MVGNCRKIKNCLLVWVILWVLIKTQTILAGELCWTIHTTEWKCDSSPEGDKILKRECETKWCCWTEEYIEEGKKKTRIQCGEKEKNCTDPEVVAICNPWQKCFNPISDDWVPLPSFISNSIPWCYFDHEKSNTAIENFADRIKIDEKDITFWDGRGRVGEDSEGNLIPLNLPVKFRWITKVPGPLGLGLDCGPDGFMIDILGVGSGGVTLIHRPLNLKEAFSEIVPLKEYQPPYRNKPYDEVPFEYRTMVEEIAFKDEEIYDFCPKDPENNDNTRDRYKLKEKWKEAFENRSETKIRELGEFLVKFTRDNSLLENTGSMLTFFSQASSYSLGSNSIFSKAGKGNNLTTGVNFEKLKRALWGRVEMNFNNYNQKYHIDVFQRRKQIEYFIPFKECKETTDENSEIGRKLKELSKKYCTNRGGRRPNVSLNELIKDLEENSTSVAFVYSPSQDKYQGWLPLLNPGPCKIKSGNLFDLPAFSPTLVNFRIGYYKTHDLIVVKIDTWTNAFGEKNFLVNPSPEPVGILVFRVFDPGYKVLSPGNTLSSSSLIFPDKEGVFSEKIHWKIPQKKSENSFSTSSSSIFSAIVERWVDPDWNGPDFLDVTRTQITQNGIDYPLGGADFVDFQFCGQDTLRSSVGVQIRAKYRGEILLTDYDDSEKSEKGLDLVRGFILDPEVEPLPHQIILYGLYHVDPPWKEIKHTAYSEQSARECVSVKEPPPTLLYSTAFYTWPFIARTNQIDPFPHFIPLTRDLQSLGKIFTWLGRSPRDRKIDIDPEDHAKWDTGFIKAPEMGLTNLRSYPISSEYEIQLCNPIQSPSRLRWTLFTTKDIRDLEVFLMMFFNNTYDLIGVLADERVKEKCISTQLIHQIPILPTTPEEWSKVLKRSGRKPSDEEIEECVKALTRAIQIEIDKKCPPNQEWIIDVLDAIRAPAFQLELKIDWRNDAYYAGGASLMSEGYWVIEPPYPHYLWWHDIKNSYFPAWPRVNGVEFRFANFEKSTEEGFPSWLQETPLVVGPWSQIWHFRLASAFYKTEEVPIQNSDLSILSFNLFTIQDFQKETKLDPLFENEDSVLEARKKGVELVANRLQRMLIPQIGRTLSTQIIVKESISRLGMIGTMRVALPIPRFASQLRYRPPESLKEQGRCELQRFNFWQVWPAIIPWRHPDLLGTGSTDVDHLLGRSTLEWYDNKKGDRPAGVNDLTPEEIRERVLENELYFYILPCQEEFGKAGSCYGWLGFLRDEKSREKIKVTYEKWSDITFKFRITGSPPNQLQPGTRDFPGQNFTIRDLPPVKIPNKFVWERKKGGARYLVEIAKGLIEESDQVSHQAMILESLELGKREFAPTFGENKVFLEFFKEEGPYTWTVRTCADHCTQLEKYETPSSSEKLWCGKPSQPHYFFGCFLTPPDLPLKPVLGEIYLPEEEIEFSWAPIVCGEYPIYYELKVLYGIKDWREKKRECKEGTEVLHVFTQEPYYATATFECLGTYHWAIRACVAQDDNLASPSLACSAWTTGDWSKLWYFNILTERVPPSGITQFRICHQCENLLPQSCRDSFSHTRCGLREIVQLIFNILNCLLWCISLILLIILIGATGAILILKASEFDVLEKIKNAWKGYGIGLAIMFLAWTILNLIFEVLNWQRQTFGDWWNPFP